MKKNQNMKLLFTERNRSILSIFIIVLVVFACKKESDNNNIDPSTSLIKTIIEKNSAGDVISRIEYQYDGQRRILIQKYYFPSDSANATFSYEYLPSVVVEKMFRDDTILTNKSVYYLNGEGLATQASHVAYHNYPDSVTIPNSIYEYDSKGYMIKNITFSHDSSVYKSLTWQIAEGNITSYVYNIPGIGINATETYFYNPGSINSVGNNNKGMMFLGKSNTNLVDSSVLTQAYMKTAKFIYTFDSNNRVSKTTVSGNTLITIASDISYEYY
jgi:hypothetical protein